MAASTVTHCAPPDSTVADGSIQARWAAAGAGRPRTTPTDAAASVRKSLTVILLWASGLESQRDRAELALAERLGRRVRSRGPLKRHAQELAAADLARGFDDQLVLTGRQRGERRAIAAPADLVLAGRPRGAGEAVDRHRQLAA